MSNEEIVSRKKDLELFLNILKMNYREYFDSELNDRDMLFFCKLIDEDEQKLYRHSSSVLKKNSGKLFKDLYDLSKGVYPFRKCPIFDEKRIEEEKKAFLEVNYLDLQSKIDKEYGSFNDEFELVDGFNKNDMKYIFYSFLLPIEDMNYYNEELDKEYVDLNIFMSIVSKKYGVSEDALSMRLREVKEIINSNSYTRKK